MSHQAAGSRSIRTRVASSVADFRRFLTRGRAHRRRLDAIDVRVAVTGTRGKSTAVTWLYEALAARGYDVYAKVTGEEPQSMYAGVTHPIERDGPVRLYETEREIRRFGPADAIVVENQGIREYTTRLVSTDYVDPTIVVLTNVRRDHLHTLGRDLGDVARALARAVPEGVTVVAGERNPVLLDYLDRELARRDATLVRAIDRDVGRRDDAGLRNDVGLGDLDAGGLDPAAELLAVVDATLAEIGVDRLSPAERADFRDRMHFEWIALPEGRVFHAAKVNDVESTDRVRLALGRGRDEPITPLVYFRADRPGRTASFIEYLASLADRGLVDRIHAVGAHRGPVTRRLDVPVVWHDEDTESPAAVLDAALAEGRAVLTMGNGVPDFMQELRAVIEARRETARRDVREVLTTGEGPRVGGPRLDGVDDEATVCADDDPNVESAA